MTIEIKVINTKPESDPYHFDTGGISHTVFWLRPEDRTCGVEQEYRSNSTLMSRYNNLELFWWMSDFPSEFDMRKWIEENSSTLEEICDGHTVEWNGNNMVGKMTKNAMTLQWLLGEELENGILANYYEVYTAESWLDSVRDMIKAEMSDKELENLVENWEPTGEIVIIGRFNLLDYAKERRDELKNEMELEAEE